MRGHWRVGGCSPPPAPFSIRLCHPSGSEPGELCRVFGDPDAIDFCVFDEHGVETAHRLTERTGHAFHGIVDGAGIGTRYGLRVHGPWDPENGLRHNAHKLLLDPHATAVEGQWTLGFHHHTDSRTTTGRTPMPQSITFLLEHDGADSFALLLNAAENGVAFTIPDAQQQMATRHLQ